MPLGTPDIAPTLPKKIMKVIEKVKREKKKKYLKDLDNNELTLVHAFAHESQSDLLHAFSIEEYKERQRTHPYLDWLDREIELLIQDWRTYSARKLAKTASGKRVLADDHRLTHIWMNRLRRGKKMESKQFKGLSLTQQKKVVRSLHNQIIKVFKSLDWEHETPIEKLSFKASAIQRKDLEDIDDVFIKKLSDSQLKDLDERLHEIYEEVGKIHEPLHNSHVFVWKEMKRRRISHDIDDPLTDDTALEVVEYPTPRGEASLEKKVEIPDAKGTISLERALKAFPDQVTIFDPPQQIHITGRIVNKGKIPPGHDIDVLFKQGVDERLIKEFLKAVRARDPEIAKRIHFVFDSSGPKIGYSIPLYRLGYKKLRGNELVKHSPWEYLKANIKVGVPVRALKAQSGFKKFEFFEVSDLWHLWAAERVNKGIVIQKKYDGMRFQIHKIGDTVKIITEDRQRDRADFFKKSIQELVSKIKADGFILDTEMVEYNCQAKKIKDKEELCDQLPREEMIPWIVAKKQMDDENIVFHVHDCMAYNNQDITQKGYLERYDLAKKIIGSKLEHFRMVPYYSANSKVSFERVLFKIRRLKGSEGAMLKTEDSIYKLTGRTSNWAKIKNVKEIDVMVWEVIPKKTREGRTIPGQYLYRAAFKVSKKEKMRERDLVEWKGKTYAIIGKTYSTSIKAKKGDIITVKPIRIAQYKTKDKKIYFTWMFPWFSNKHPTKKEPDGIETVKRLAKAGTAPLTNLSEEVIKLEKCKFFNDNRICPLKATFAHPMDQLSRKRMALQFPIACPFADYARCRYVKPYYYGIDVDKEGKEKLIEFEVDIK